MPTPSPSSSGASPQQETVFDTRQRESFDTTATNTARRRTLIIVAVIAAVIILAIVLWVVTHQPPPQQSPSGFIHDTTNDIVMQVHATALMIKGAFYVGT